jgi:hypothetical protein
MPWRPSAPGDYPTLGWIALDWISEYLAAPDRGEYEPFELTSEQAEFVLGFYRLDPVTGRRRIRRALIGRPRGWGKSPLLAALCALEGLGPVVPDGWDAEGQPVGRPWADVRTPLVQLAAVSEDQVDNTWLPLQEMLAGPVADAYPGVEVLGTFINLPRGKIQPITSSSTSVKGAKAVFSVLDQTEEWTASNGGVKLAKTMRVNAAKIGGTTVESPNAYIPGMGSVAEASAAYAKTIREGRARSTGLLYDHREAPADTDMSDYDSLIAGLAVAYGDSAAIDGGCRIHTPPCERRGWVDLDRIVGEVWDPDIDPQTSRTDFLNHITHATDSWLSAPEWGGCADATRIVEPGDAITLGFDGSRKRARGVTDATALIGCRLSDGHLFEIGVWEQPEGPAGDQWQIPVTQVLAAIHQAFARYRVIGMYADPAKWESHIVDLEAKYSPKLKVKASRDHPMHWWMTGGRALKTVRILEEFHDAVTGRQLTHDGSSALTRHVLNARRRTSRVGVQIAKDHPDSPRKIDGAIAAVLARTCRQDAVAAGVTAQDGFYPASRIR